MTGCRDCFGVWAIPIVGLTVPGESPSAAQYLSGVVVRSFHGNIVNHVEHRRKRLQSVYLGLGPLDMGLRRKFWELYIGAMLNHKNIISGSVPFRALKANLPRCNQEYAES